MHLSLILALQAAAAPPPPEPQPRWAMPRLIASDPGHFDLAQAPAASGGNCGARGESDVLVCGTRRTGGAYPMAYWARIFAPEPPIRAEMGLGGNVQGRIYTEAVAMPRGEISKRVMVGIRWPF